MRFIVLLYGVASYLSFLGALLYLAGFINGVMVPRGIDDGVVSSFPVSLFVNLSLIFLFAAQHTIMARPWFKAWWRRTLPTPIERSTFVLFASATLVLLYWQWRPLPELIWNIESPPAVYALYGLQALGWGLVLLSSFLINHFELFGLQQVFFHWRQKRPTPPTFRLPWLYQLVRHPLMLGFLVAFWSTPTMSQGRLLFTITMTIYTFMGVHFEERDLVRAFGDQYRKYQAKTSMIFPISRR